jgi:hypothetical protein
VRRGRGSEDEGAPFGGFHARIEFPEAPNRRPSLPGTFEAGYEPAEIERTLAKQPLAFSNLY